MLHFNYHLEFSFKNNEFNLYCYYKTKYIYVRLNSKLKENFKNLKKSCKKKSI